MLGGGGGEVGLGILTLQRRGDISGRHWLVDVGRMPLLTQTVILSVKLACDCKRLEIFAS